MINKLVICGVGLIGGSFAAALKRANAVKHIVGVAAPGRTLSSLNQAQQLGLIDEVSDDFAHALCNANVFLLATPVGQFDGILKLAAQYCAHDTIITDAGSTKQNVVRLLQQYFSDSLDRVVPAHPIAGAETSGPQAAQATLYEDRNVILTPLTETNDNAIDTIQQLWHACGANTLAMTPAHHDEVFAAVSHLPHVLAFAFMREIGQRKNWQELLNLAGSGFRDFTRIAASNSQMWRDICIANRPAILAELERHIDQLKVVQTLLQNSDADALAQLFADASNTRQHSTN